MHKNHLLNHRFWHPGPHSARCCTKRNQPRSKTGGRSDIEMTKHHIMTFHFCLSTRIALPDHYLCLVLIFQSSVINNERKQNTVLEAQRPRLQNKNAANPKRGPEGKGGELWKLPLFLPLFCQDSASGFLMCEKDNFPAILSTKFLPHISLQRSPPVLHTQSSWGFCSST